MNDKAELIEQLTSMRNLIHDRDTAEQRLADIKREINRLKQENERGVPYQCWHATDNAQKTRQAIEEEVQTRKVRRRTPCIVVLSVCGGFGFYALLGSVAIGVILLIIAIIALILLVSVQKNGDQWSYEQQEQLKKAEQTDAENTRLNQQKKAALEADLCKKNNARIAELTQDSKEVEKDLGKALIELSKYSILSQKDQKWSTVQELIEILRGNRANSLQEAFRIFDEQQHREQVLKEQREAAWEQQRLQKKMLDQLAENEAHRQEEAELLRQDMLRRQQAEEEHNREMERLAQKQIDELEKKRQEDRDYRRSGYIKGGG